MLQLVCKSKTAIVDLQGFYVSGFVIKEIAILTNENLHHWVFLPPYPWNNLHRLDKIQANWVIQHHHKIKWECGWEKYEEASTLIQSALQDVEIIYVKGLQKISWLRFFLNKNIKIINVEDLECNFKINDNLGYKFTCTSHDGICSINNVFRISCWLENK